jgi:hypothetical protein
LGVPASPHQWRGRGDRSSGVPSRSTAACVESDASYFYVRTSRRARRSGNRDVRVREVFPFLMLSRFIDCAFTEPRRYAGDHATIEMCYPCVDIDNEALAHVSERGSHTWVWAIASRSHTTGSRAVSGSWIYRTRPPGTPLQHRPDRLRAGCDLWSAHDWASIGCCRVERSSSAMSCRRIQIKHTWTIFWTGH